MTDSSMSTPLIIHLSGRIDSNNAAETEKEIQNTLKEQTSTPVVLDMNDLEYISSAGLRVILRLKKTYPDLTLINVHSEVYEILEMTGFTEMMTVHKAYRVVSIEGCEEIGRGANGIVYRIDQDNVVKVYSHSQALEDIQHEREMARIALVSGIPTAISYDVVRVGDSYGSVFELLNARSFAKILAEEPDKMDWCVKEFADMLKLIHSISVPEGKLPRIKDWAVSWAEFLQDYLPKEAGEKLLAMIQAVPDDNHMVHGDYHPKNLELQNDEVLLIDMDTLSVGNPIFEFSQMYNALQGFADFHHENINSFMGFDYETGRTFLRKVTAAYLGTENEKKIQETLEKAKLIGYTRLLRRIIRRGHLETEEGKAEVEFLKSKLIELLEKTNTLLFIRNELEIDAEPENIPEVQSFVESHLEGIDCSPRVLMQIAVAVEEIFMNIASYAYTPDKGKATVRVEVSEEPAAITLTFTDHGKPYNPLAKADPDVTLSATEREIGGLGIFMTKKAMDEVVYEYRNDSNILILKKNL